MRAWQDLRPAFTPTPLCQSSGWSLSTYWLDPRIPKGPRNPLSKTGDRRSPHDCCFRQFLGKWRHQSAIAVALLKEPFPPKLFRCEQIEKQRINLRADGLHQIGRKTVTTTQVVMEDANSRIKSKRGKCQSGLGFEDGVQVIKMQLAG